MVSQQTLKRQIRKMDTQSRGSWVRFLGDYTSQAFNYSNFTVWSLDGESFRVSEYAPSFYVHVTKADNKRWYAYTEEHDQEELIAQGFPENGFATLYEAKCWLEEWSEDFEALWLENEMGIEDLDEIWANF